MSYAYSKYIAVLSVLIHSIMVRNMLLQYFTFSALVLFLSALKVSQAERARFIAAIVYNNESNVLIEMTDPSKALALKT